MHCAKACQIKRTLFLVLAEKSQVRPENQTLLALTNVTVNDLGTRNRFVVCVKMKCNVFARLFDFRFFAVAGGNHYG